MVGQTSRPESGSSRNLIDLGKYASSAILPLLTLTGCVSPDSSSQIDLNNVIEKQKAQETPIAVYKYGPDQSAYLNLDKKDLIDLNEKSTIKNIYVYSALDDSSSIIIRTVSFADGKNITLFNQEDNNPESVIIPYESTAGFLTDKENRLIYSHFIEIEKDGQTIPVSFFEISSNINADSVDPELIQKAQTGDENAFEELIRLFREDKNVTHIKLTNVVTGKEVTTQKGDKDWDKAFTNLVTVLTGAKPAQAADQDQTSPTPEPTLTPPPTSTPEPSPTPTEIPIPTLAPELVGGLEGIPDPKISNPELFDLTKKDAPIPEFVYAMKMAGIEVTGEQVTKEISFQEYKETVIGVTPEGYPLFIYDQNNKIWRSETITYLLATNNIKFGFPYNIKSNPNRKIVRAPDLLVAHHSTISFPEDAFWWSFSSSTIDEYLSFVKTYNIDGGSPHIFWPGNEGYYSSNHDVLVNKITGIVNHCKENIHGWTLNELFDDDGTLKDTKNVELVINTIRKADPNAQIVINEYGLEYNSKKESAFYNYVISLKSAGVLKEGDVIGIQGHNGIDFNKTTKQIEQLAEKYIKLGLKVRFTELDVFGVKDQNSNTLKTKANYFNKFISAAINLNNKYRTNVVDAIIVYGSTNNSSWVRDLGKKGEFPVLLNSDGSPEYTYYLLSKYIWESLISK